MEFYIVLIIGIFGLLIGSFLNSVIYRLHTGESIINSRSHCTSCLHNLVWYDLIPVFSFMILGGKCRYCKAGISIKYPLVEIVTAGIFVLIFFAIGGASFGGQFLTLFYLLFVFSGLIVIFVYDLKHYLIPDKILMPVIGVVAAYRILDFFALNKWTALSVPLLAAILASSFFLALFLMSRGRWMGFGDVKLSFFMGLFLGFPAILAALFLAFTSGAIIGVSLILLGRKTLQSKVPFGPFLILGTAVSFFWGNAIITWYLNILSL